MATALPDALERRVLSHLSIPRNVEDLSGMLRTDAGVTELLPEADVYEKLQDLEAHGWVLNLGEHHDMAKLAAKVEGTKAKTMPDEKAEIFSRRLKKGELRWRVKGDVWMFTDAGHQASYDATHQETPAPLTLEGLKGAIEQEYARVQHDAPLEGSIHDERGGYLDPEWAVALGPHLLSEEFDFWLGLVTKGLSAEDKKYVTSGLRPPMKGGSQFSDYYEAIQLDAENQKGTITAAAPWYMALVETTAITDADTGSTLDEPEYTGYARKSVAAADMNAASGSSGSVSNANAIIFAACTSGTDTAIGFANCVASTVGNIRKYGTCSSTVISTTQTPAQFAAGAYTTTIA